jgi:hypothetical protein
MDPDFDRMVAQAQARQGPPQGHTDSGVPDK